VSDVLIADGKRRPSLWAETMLPQPFVTLDIVVLYLLAFLLIWVFSGYPLLMPGFALRHKNAGNDYLNQPFISVLVPTYNEEAVIEKRIQNLRDLQ
jgi:cellulose synthase/poly-beta-1,6-N-acetylglucosamine synthase-like glycosyltransferase